MSFDNNLVSAAVIISGLRPHPWAFTNILIVTGHLSPMVTSVTGS